MYLSLFMLLRSKVRSLMMRIFLRCCGQRSEFVNKKDDLIRNHSFRVIAYGRLNTLLNADIW